MQHDDPQPASRQPGPICGKREKAAMPWFLCWPLPVPVYEAGVDVIGALDAPDGLQTDSCQLVWHDVHEAVLEFVAWEVGTDET